MLQAESLVSPLQPAFEYLPWLMASSMKTDCMQHQLQSILLDVDAHCRSSQRYHAGQFKCQLAICCMHVLKPHLQAGKAGSATARRTSSSSEGGAGQLVASRAASGRWGPASAPGSALDLGVLQAQVRSKNRVIADLRTQKLQLSGERRQNPITSASLRLAEPASGLVRVCAPHRALAARPRHAGGRIS